MTKQPIKGIYFSTEKLTDQDRIEIRNAMKLAEHRKKKQVNANQINNKGDDQHDKT